MFTRPDLKITICVKVCTVPYFFSYMLNITEKLTPAKRSQFFLEQKNDIPQTIWEK